MRLCSRLLRLFAALFLVSSAFAVTEIPFEADAGMVWVNVSTSGQAAPLHFLLDSGASASVLDSGTARRLGVPLGAAQSVQGVYSRGTAYHLPTFVANVAGAPVPSTILALDLSAVSAGCHRHIDGLLGADFFRGRVIQIDYAALKVRLLTSGETRGAGSIVPLSTRNGVFCARVSVAGSKAEWTRVDTGCNTALQWVASSGATGQTHRATIGLSNGTGSSISSEVQVGNERLSGVKVGLHARPIFAGEAGLLGGGVLSRFSSVTFDAPGQRLLLVKR